MGSYNSKQRAVLIPSESGKDSIAACLPTLNSESVLIPSESGKDSIPDSARKLARMAS